MPYAMTPQFRCCTCHAPHISYYAAQECELQHIADLVSAGFKSDLRIIISTPTSFVDRTARMAEDSASPPSPPPSGDT